MSDEQRSSQSEIDALPASRPGARAQEAIARLLSEPLEAGLYLVATPIGNLGDITLRALGVLARADIIYCEDTRHSAKLLQHYSITARTRPFHDHNEDREIERAIGDLESGKRIAIISDAGTPLLSDPGFKLVRAAAAAGVPVVPIPGASALLAALTASGLPTDAFFFAGFLPPKKASRRARLAELSPIPGSLVFYEAPHRVAETLGDMAGLLGERQAVVARELTKLHEEIARGSLAELAGTATEDMKGEVVIVVGPVQAQVITDEALGARLAAALEVMSLKDAARALADEFGVPKARVYGLGIKSKGEQG
ncbi:16S rRNA (cytidine(1402)-2'-O)-methyltransferase [Hyphomicrobium sp. 99]|uniref:16S rRNA (cytidine(1402)-2'-O)-methyltransferase n=1 Tax=Hyphomicrobium sp. 99 TaxID=1163419 RepID=UPI0009E1DF1D|nr:16S rRNA (cytidine(1402)-2'-O)-methyltransferase [Hyphomicrobium sp. 99]